MLSCLNRRHYFFGCILLVYAKLTHVYGSKFRWRDLTPSELDDWYSPFDQCMFNTTDFGKSPQLIKRLHCLGASTKLRGKKEGFCRVGMGSNKKECSAPYSGRRSYRRGVDGFTDASSSPIIDAFKRLGDANTALVLLGDSTMTQKRNALECELLRESPVGADFLFSIFLICSSRLLLQSKNLLCIF